MKPSVLLVPLLLAAPALRAAEIWIDELDLAAVEQGWGEPHRNRSVDGNRIAIGGQLFERGLGTHADSILAVRLDGGASRFTAKVGMNEEVRGQPGSVEFIVDGDEKTLWRSGVMKPGQAPKEASADLAGVKLLMLRVTDGGDGISYDHADWAEAKIAYAGRKPEALLPPAEEAVVLTPRPAPAPRINGARVFGVRPGSPVLYLVAATGEEPLAYAAEGLPDGLALDAKTGRLTGRLDRPGEHRIALRVRNARGEARRELRLVAGDRLALTPPMGWNSWNCFAHAVDTDKIKSAARALVDSGLARHGWQYINIDDFWQVKPGTDDPTLKGPARDAEGRILPNPRFPDMKGLADYVHGLGLKIGLYSSPGPLTCGGCAGSHGHEEADARSYAEWGFDYLKYDWCSYGQISRGDTREELMKPYLLMSRHLRAQPRDIVFSLCQYGMGKVSEWGTKAGGQCWRTTGDITDTWSSMAGIGFGQAGLEPFAGPGSWNDPDMLVVGHVGWGPSLHPTKLKPNEQYTHISLWCLLASPLLIGCDLTKLDDFTLGLLANDEVLEVNQDPLGRQAARVAQDGSREVWAKAMEDGSLAVGLFNRGLTPLDVRASWTDLKLTGRRQVRDLWRQKDLGAFEDAFTATVPRHGVVLVRIR